MSFTDFLENEVLDDLFQQQDAGFTPSGTLYFALSTTTPTDAGANFTEPPSASGYARVSVASTGTNWYTSNGGTKGNKAAITWSAATGPWGTVTYVGIYDNITSGNLYGKGQLTVPKAIDNGDTASFAANSGIQISLD
jgi:hypothetical protein